MTTIPETSGLVRDNPPYLVTTGAARLSRSALLALAACFLSSASAAPPTPSPSPAANRNATGPQTYDSFRLVHTRNVFDPDRRPVRAPGATAPAAPTRADYVALTGIAVDGDKSLAFFSGSRAEFNLVIPANSKVAGATVTKINPVNIEVERNGRKLVVNVGQTVPLDDKSNPAAAPFDQPAAITGPTASATTTTTATANTTAAPPAAGSAPGAAAPPANIEEIRRRMMERHNQDQK